MKNFNAQKVARQYITTVKKYDVVVAKAEDSRLAALAAISNEYQLYNAPKQAKEFLEEVFGEGRAAASRRSEGNKIIITAAFYGEMKQAYAMHSKADTNQSKPKAKDYILKLATKLRTAKEFDRTDAVAAEVYQSMIADKTPGKKKPVDVSKLADTINSLTTAQKRKLMALIAG